MIASGQIAFAYLETRVANCRAAGELERSGAMAKSCVGPSVQPPWTCSAGFPFQIRKAPPRGFEHEHQIGREAGNGRTCRADGGTGVAGGGTRQLARRK